jgi:O-acetyl-ADP-ribose deacetylase (regulator of RNase III)
MDFHDKTDILLDKLKEDSGRYKNLETDGMDASEKKDVIRSLVNVRMPRAVPAGLLELEDDYLQGELAAKGIVSLCEIPVLADTGKGWNRGRQGMDNGNAGGNVKGIASPVAERISLWQGDVTRLEVGAIVNAANSQMLGCFVPCHKCIDNAIHSAAGMRLRAECNHIMNRRRALYGAYYEEPTGTATVTRAYNLPCEYVIHTVGPIVHGELSDALRRDLRNCYANVLKCCVENQITSVAFCCISTGEFHFPNEEAAKIAWETVREFLQTHAECMERVIFNVYQDKDREIYERLFSETM